MRRKLNEILDRLHVSPVGWANLGAVSRLIARAAPPSRPPVLIVSHPRSGSTWLGYTLAQSPTALYLKEPLTLSHLRDRPSEIVFELPDGRPPPAYARAAESVALALPAFWPNVVPAPAPWRRLAERRQRRLVVKEVNPLALGWLIERWRPIVIYLVRHPAGVAASFAARGWLDDFGPEGFARRFDAARIRSGEIAPERYQGSVWREIGAVQAIVLRLGLAALRAAPSHVVIRYEDLCADPRAVFERLCRFTGLAWDDRLEAAIAAQSRATHHDRADAYGTIRNSRIMAGAWKSELSAEQIAEVKVGWLAHAPAYYPEGEW
jgi:hypothetical protein